jgi:DNA-binding transcriptional MocR family regulator
MTQFNPRLDASGPLYIQIAEQIGRAMLQGTLIDGDLLPSIRDLAARTGIHVSTVARAYREAEKRGLISGTTGSGTYVTGGAAERSSLASPEPYAPGMTEMGIVSPLPHLDPDLGCALRAVARRKNMTAFMTYHAPGGFMQHREAGRIWMKRYAAEYTAEDIVICSGSQHALVCILMSHFRDGDRIAADELTYPGFKTAAAMLRIKLIPVRMDAKGMMPDELETACRREKIKGLFLMPSIQNPTVSSMDERRKDAIALVAARYGLLVIEDDAYIHSLNSPGTPIAARIPEHTVFIAGVSKAMAAGLRISFVAAGKSGREKISRAIVNSAWMSPPLNAEIVSMWIRDGSAEKTILAKRAEARTRNQIARKKLKNAPFSSSECGYYIWLPMKHGVSGKAFENMMRKKGISIFSAERFAAGSAAADTAVRISLTSVISRDELARALTIISQSI